MYVIPNQRDGGFNLIWGTLRRGVINQIYVDLVPSFVPYVHACICWGTEHIRIKIYGCIELHIKEHAWKAKCEGWELKTVFFS